MSASGIARDHLKSFVERIERLEEEQKDLASDKRDVYEEAKGNGFDVKALRAIIAMRKRDADELREHQLIVETYLEALGPFAETALGKASIVAATTKRKRELATV